MAIGQRRDGAIWPWAIRSMRSMSPTAKRPGLPAPRSMARTSPCATVRAIDVVVSCSAAAALAPGRPAAGGRAVFDRLELPEHPARRRRLPVQRSLLFTRWTHAVLRGPLPRHDVRLRLRHRNGTGDEQARLRGNVCSGWHTRCTHSSSSATRSKPSLPPMSSTVPSTELSCLLAIARVSGRALRAGRSMEQEITWLSITIS